MTCLRLLKNAHPHRFSRSSSLGHTCKVASRLGMSRALNLVTFEQSSKSGFFRTLMQNPRPEALPVRFRIERKKDYRLGINAVFTVPPQFQWIELSAAIVGTSVRVWPSTEVSMPVSVA
jgi:hypothetical protein